MSNSADDTPSRYMTQAEVKALVTVALKRMRALAIDAQDIDKIRRVMFGGREPTDIELIAFFSLSEDVIRSFLDGDLS